MRPKEGDKLFDWRMWCWVARENRALYKVHVISGDGLYDKHKKDIEYILSTIRTYKIPKK